MPTTLNMHKSTSRLLLSYVEREYDEKVSDWRDIERKAQGTIAISAIFITGIVLSFKIFFAVHYSILAILILSLSILIFVVTRSITALRVNSYHGIENSESILKEANRIFDESDQAIVKKKLCEFVNDRANGWIKASKDLESINANKVKALDQSQTWLLNAIYTLCAGIILTIIINALKIPINEYQATLDIPVHVCECVDNSQCNSNEKNIKKNKSKNSKNKLHKSSRLNKKPCNEKHPLKTEPTKVL